VSSHGISAMAEIINPPTTTNAGAVAAEGTTPMSGATNKVAMNSSPVYYGCDAGPATRGHSRCALST